MLKKHYKIITFTVYIIVGIFYILLFNYYFSSNKVNAQQVISTPTSMISNQWTDVKNKKIINRFSTFLFKTPDEHPVKNKLLIQAKAHEVYHITNEDKQQLFDQQLVDSELLYNDVVEVLEIQGDYAKVIALQQPNGQDNKGYIGWVFLTDLSDIPSTYAQAQQVIVKVPQLIVNEQTFSMGSYLPVVKENNQSYDVATLKGIITVNKQDVINRQYPIDISEMLQVGKQLIGTPYVWAGISGKGLDCSGLVYTLYRLANVELPRDTPLQTMAGQEVANYTEAQPGDILLFTNEQGITHHVGIYLGNDEMLHAPNLSSPIEIMNIKGTVYEQQLSHIRRIIK